MAEHESECIRDERARRAAVRATLPPIGSRLVLKSLDRFAPAELVRAQERLGYLLVRGHHEDGDEIYIEGCEHSWLPARFKLWEGEKPDPLNAALVADGVVLGEEPAPFAVGQTVKVVNGGGYNGCLARVLRVQPYKCPKHSHSHQVQVCFAGGAEVWFPNTDIREIGHDGLTDDERLAQMTKLLPTKHAERKARPIFSGCIAYFPDALMEVARVSVIGNEQHNPGQPLHWHYGKSMDHRDCEVRHMIDFDEPDEDDGALHAAKEAWRALANLQTFLEKRDPKLHAKRQAQRERAAKGER